MNAMGRSRPDGWWYPWIFVGGMGVVIVVNLVLVAFAVGTFSGIGTEDHYRKGLAYDTAIDAERRQAERGWSMELTVHPQPATGNARRTELAATFTDKYGRPLEDLTVRAEVVRPTHDGHDLETTFAHRGDGRYSALVDLPLAGQWDARVHARRGAAAYRENHRIFVPR